MQNQQTQVGAIQKPFVALGLGVIGTISMFLGWFQIGQRVRNSFQTIDSIIQTPIGDSVVPNIETLLPLFETLWLFLPALALAGPMLVIASYKRTGWIMSITFHLLLGLAATAAAFRNSTQVGNIMGLVVALVFFIYLIASSLLSRTSR